MAVPLPVSITVQLNKVVFLGTDISMQLIGPMETYFSNAITFQGSTFPLVSQSACITVSVILQWMTGNRTLSLIHRILPSLRLGVGCRDGLIQHPSLGVSA
jgi:hypothetical protein